MRIHSCSRARSSDSWAGRRRSTPVDGLSMPMGGGPFHDDRRLAALGALRALQVQLDQVATLQLRWRVTSDSPARCPRAPCPLLIWFSTSQRIVGYQQPLCSPPRPVRVALCSPTPSQGNTLAMSGSRTTMLAPPQTSAGRTVLPADSPQVVLWRSSSPLASSGSCFTVPPAVCPQQSLLIFVASGRSQGANCDQVGIVSGSGYAAP